MEKKLNNLTEITLKMIVDAGLINADTALYSDTNPVKTAKINSDGFIEIDINGNRKLFPYPSGAARAIVNLSVNGWKFWKINLNDELKELSDLRAIYKEQFT
ncbi:MAG: hypothetical protein V4714_20185 [Bacteroidota bacterium]